MSVIGPIWRWPVQHGRMTVIRRAVSRDAKARWFDMPRRRYEPPQGRQHTACQWIEGQPAGRSTLFCNAPVMPGRSWCACHFARVFQPQPEEV